MARKKTPKVEVPLESQELPQTWDHLCEHRPNRSGVVVYGMILASTQALEPEEPFRRGAIWA